MVTKRKLVGLIENEEIWEMKEADFLPFPKGTMHLTETQVGVMLFLLCPIFKIV